MITITTIIIYLNAEIREVGHIFNNITSFVLKVIILCKILYVFVVKENFEELIFF